jgi:hypothetical protein
MRAFDPESGSASEVAVLNASDCREVIVIKKVEEVASVPHAARAVPLRERCPSQGRIARERKPPEVEALSPKLLTSARQAGAPFKF